MHDPASIALEGPEIHIPAEVAALAGIPAGEQTPPPATPLGPEFVKPPASARAPALRPQMFAGEEFTQQLEASANRREEAYHARYEWHGQELRWTLRRESLWNHLRTVLGFPSLESIMKRPEVSAYLGDATLILFLGLHEPAAWDGIREQPKEFHAAIEQWAESGAWHSPANDQGRFRYLPALLNKSPAPPAAPEPVPIIPIGEHHDACRLARRIIFDVLDSIPQVSKILGEKPAGNSPAQ